MPRWNRSTGDRVGWALLGADDGQPIVGGRSGEGELGTACHGGGGGGKAAGPGVEPRDGERAGGGGEIERGGAALRQINKVEFARLREAVNGVIAGAARRVAHRRVGRLSTGRAGRGLFHRQGR